MPKLKRRPPKFQSLRKADPATIRLMITELAFNAWREAQPAGSDKSKLLFDELFIGHFATIDHYTDGLIDALHLDDLLDATIEEPFRRHVDVDVTSLSRALVADGSISVILALPVGVWIFRGSRSSSRSEG